MNWAAAALSLLTGLREGRRVPANEQEGMSGRRDPGAPPDGSSEASSAGWHGRELLA